MKYFCVDCGKSCQSHEYPLGGGWRCKHCHQLHVYRKKHGRATPKGK